MCSCKLPSDNCYLSNSSASSCFDFHQATKNRCDRCCVKSMLNDHTYCMLKRICRRIVTDLCRSHCREEYTIFNGGDSLKLKVQRDFPYGTDSTKSTPVLNATGDNTKTERPKKSDTNKRGKSFDSTKRASKNLAQNTGEKIPAKIKKSNVPQANDYHSWQQDIKAKAQEEKKSQKPQSKDRGGDDIQLKGKKGKPEIIEIDDDKRKEGRKGKIDVQQVVGGKRISKKGKTDIEDQENNKKGKKGKVGVENEDEDEDDKRKKSKKGKQDIQDIQDVNDKREKNKKGKLVEEDNVAKLQKGKKATANLEDNDERRNNVKKGKLVEEDNVAKIQKGKKGTANLEDNDERRNNVKKRKLGVESKTKNVDEVADNNDKIRKGKKGKIDDENDEDLRKGNKKTTNDFMDDENKGARSMAKGKKEKAEAKRNEDIKTKDQAREKNIEDETKTKARQGKKKNSLYDEDFRDKRKLKEMKSAGQSKDNEDSEEENALNKKQSKTSGKKITISKKNNNYASDDEETLTKTRKRQNLTNSQKISVNSEKVTRKKDLSRKVQYDGESQSSKKRVIYSGRTIKPCDVLRARMEEREYSAMVSKPCPEHSCTCHEKYGIEVPHSDLRSAYIQHMCCTDFQSTPNCV